MTATPGSAIEEAAPRLHGEYKVPGGKLVVVDLDTADGALADVSLSGDFFLEPDEALLAINGALTGLPESSTAADIAAAVEAALPEDAVLFGFSSDGRTTTGTSSRPQCCPRT